MAVQERLYTADDLWERAHEERDKRFELLRGKIIEMSPPGGLHGQTAGDIYVLLRAFTKQHQLGYVTVETGYIIATDPHTVLAPDVAFISHDLSVVRALCDRVYVMRAGIVEEEGTSETLFRSPTSAYTRALIDAIPLPEPDPGWLARGAVSEDAA